jgi:hypothetical protein
MARRDTDEPSGVEPSCEFFVSIAARAFYRGLWCARIDHPIDCVWLEHCGVIAAERQGGCGDADRGRGRLALSDDKKSKRKTQAPARQESGHGSGDRDVGHALRTVYSKTVSEEIPSELLDLLGKLS